MQAIAAAWASMVLDVDDHFHPRQMGWQRAAVRPTLPGALQALCGRCLFVLFLVGGLDLLGLFEPQQQLILGERLGTPAEAVTLQFLDDLNQTGILDVARQDHRLQRVRIVGKLVSRHRHERIRPYSPTARDSGIQADSLRRGSARLGWHAGPARLVDSPPVETFE